MPKETHEPVYIISPFTEKRGFDQKRGHMIITRNCSRDGAPQSSHRSHGDLLRGVLCGAGVSSSDHVWLQQSALQVHVMIGQSLVHCSQNLEMGRVITTHPQMETFLLW